MRIGPEVDLGMKVEWLGDDLKLLGKLPKAVKDAFAAAERPAVIVGPGALAAGALGAALALAEPLGLIRTAGTASTSLHTSASRMAALILGYAQPGGIADIEAATPELVLLLGADEVRADRFKRRVQGLYRPPRRQWRAQADLVLPGAAYAEKHGTYVNTEGRVQRGEKAAFPPGEAREDWAILRAVSRACRQDAAVRQLRPASRSRWSRDYPQLGRDGPDRPAVGAAQARRQGRRPDPLPDRRLLPDQRDLPHQPDDAALLGGAGAAASPSRRRRSDRLLRQPSA